jgi:hypothetical protein
MIAEVQREFDIGPEFLNRIEFFDKPTAATLAHLVMDTLNSMPSSPISSSPSRAEASPLPKEGDCRVVTLSAAGFLPPLFCFPASDADPYYFRHLSKELGQDQPSYVVCPPLPVEGRRLLPVEEMAARAVRAILTIQPQGPYSLIGHCFGGRKAQKFLASSWWIPLLLAIPRFWQAELATWSRGLKPAAPLSGARCGFQ